MPGKNHPESRSSGPGRAAIEGGPAAPGARQVHQGAPPAICRRCSPMRRYYDRLNEL
jgi:hypothetical protein